MSDPVVAYTVKEMLTRIEAKLDAQGEEIRKLQMRDAAAGAVSRARVAVWTAVMSAVGAGSALLVAISRH
jgi:hypothetical protein